MLKYTTERVVDTQELDRLVEETYGRRYCFQQQDGCKSRGVEYFEVPLEYEPFDYKNDTIEEIVNGDEMGVSFKAWLERDPEKKIDPDYDWRTDLFWKRNFYPSLAMVVQDLYEKGLIEEGSYIIKIDW